MKPMIKMITVCLSFMFMFTCMSMNIGAYNPSTGDVNANHNLSVRFTTMNPTLQYISTCWYPDSAAVFQINSTTPANHINYINAFVKMQSLYGGMLNAIWLLNAKCNLSLTFNGGTSFYQSNITPTTLDYYSFTENLVGFNWSYAPNFIDTTGYYNVTIETSYKIGSVWYLYSQWTVEVLYAAAYVPPTPIAKNSDINILFAGVSAFIFVCIPMYVSMKWNDSDNRLRMLIYAILLMLISGGLAIALITSV